MKRFALTAAAAAALVAAPAMAQEVGSIVMGNDDAPIGEVLSNDGTTVVVNTGMHEVSLPAAAFGTSDAGPTLNITKAQLDEMWAAQLAQAEAEAEAAAAQAAAEAAAARDAALVIGAPVITTDAQALGLVDEFIGENVVVKTEDEQLVTLPRDFFALDADGALMALADLETIMAAVSGG
ncbi:hypothetical protein OZN62_04260 [Aurantiacibacter sp. MUD11]|uniref:hypothetical protein n=1 Tax=Aurantiacibacter sp. MUD11 TaxID=3003265 RepID=UPI0022AA987D|nr:hypothetical protein [Aurantiacibacter sp. MUD11]WAT18790.1 hypothetical protein OZN62_04260 [Aurantiacibacter sp. MUD11]